MTTYDKLSEAAAKAVAVYKDLEPDMPTDTDAEDYMHGQILEKIEDMLEHVYGRHNAETLAETLTPTEMRTLMVVVNRYAKTEAKCARYHDLANDRRLYDAQCDKYKALWLEQEDIAADLQENLRCKVRGY